MYLYVCTCKYTHRVCKSVWYVFVMLLTDKPSNLSKATSLEEVKLVMIIIIVWRSILTMFFSHVSEESNKNVNGILDRSNLVASLGNCNL